MDVVNLISDQSVITAKKGLLSSDLQGEMIILDTNSGCYFGLNAVASNIWKLIETPMSVQDIQDALVTQYQVEPDQCKRDTLILLQELQSEGLIEVKDETAA